MVRDLVREAGIAAPSAAERAMLEQAAALAMRAADLQAAVVRCETINCDELIRATGELRRLLTQLRKRAPKTRAPSLRESFASGAGSGA